MFLPGFFFLVSFGYHSLPRSVVMSFKTVCLPAGWPPKPRAPVTPFARRALAAGARSGLASDGAVRWPCPPTCHPSQEIFIKPFPSQWSIKYRTKLVGPGTEDATVPGSSVSPPARTSGEARFGSLPSRTQRQSAKYSENDLTQPFPTCGHRTSWQERERSETRNP